MSRINDYFIKRFETDSDFREDVELAELVFAEPDYSGRKSQELEALEPLESGERLAA